MGWKDLKESNKSIIIGIASFFVLIIVLAGFELIMGVIYSMLIGNDVYGCSGECGLGVAFLTIILFPFILSIILSIIIARTRWKHLKIIALTIIAINLAFYVPSAYLVYKGSVEEFNDAKTYLINLDQKISEVATQGGSYCLSHQEDYVTRHYIYFHIYPGAMPNFMYPDRSQHRMIDNTDAITVYLRQEFKLFSISKKIPYDKIKVVSVDNPFNHYNLLYLDYSGVYDINSTRPLGANSVKSCSFGTYIENQGKNEEGKPIIWVVE